MKKTWTTIIDETLNRGKRRTQFPNEFTIAVYMKSSKLREPIKVAHVNLIYGSHFSATEATYEVSQNMGNFVKFTKNIFKS